MRKQIVSCIFLLISLVVYTQEAKQIATAEFIQVINDRVDEGRFYYKNNWKVLREKAIKKNYIASFQLLETEATAAAPFNFMLITTYANQKQFDEREAHFQELIKENGPLKLLNNLKPVEFRKSLFGKDARVIE